MDGMTSESAFRARELSAAGIWSGRIAEMLGLDEGLVRRALAGDAFEDRAATAVEAPRPMPAPAVRSADEWPPPADDATRWEVVRPRGGGEVRVRWVQLWGQRVRINELDEVWCHACLKFRTTAQLSHPRNSCPVGLPPRGAIVVVSEEEMLEEASAPQLSELDRYWAAAQSGWWR